eukprot:3593695-Rhodomonas_salina.2
MANRRYLGSPKARSCKSIQTGGIAGRDTRNSRGPWCILAAFFKGVPAAIPRQGSRQKEFKKSRTGGRLMGRNEGTK